METCFPSLPVFSAYSIFISIYIYTLTYLGGLKVEFNGVGRERQRRERERERENVLLCNLGIV